MTSLRVRVCGVVAKHRGYRGEKGSERRTDLARESCVTGESSSLRTCGLVGLYTSRVLKAFITTAAVAGSGTRGDGFDCSSMGEFGVTSQGQSWGVGPIGAFTLPHITRP